MGVIEPDLQGVMQYKGICSSYFDLMNKEGKAGDVYTCVDTDTTYVCIDKSNWYAIGLDVPSELTEVKEPKEIKTTVCSHCEPL